MTFDKKSSIFMYSLYSEGKMSLLLHSKYIYGSDGKVVEVILPIDEFRELKRLAAKRISKLPKHADAKARAHDELSAAEMTQIALSGGAFDWLKDEPDLYSDADGEPV
ncbi:MAG: hypothetical protein ACE5I1_31750 [bacterium]